MTKTEQPKKVKPASATKKITKKKPKDKPKRPLSAYNFFFKEEREKILQLILKSEEGGDDEKDEGEKEDDDQPPIDIAKLKKEGGKVSFEEMGKLIGLRWKAISSERLSKYTSLASADTERYKKEMTEYNTRQEERMRSEAAMQKARTPVWSGMGPTGTISGYPTAPAAGSSTPSYGDSSTMGYGGMTQPGLYGAPPPQYGGYQMDPATYPGGMNMQQGGIPGMGNFYQGQYGYPPSMSAGTTQQQPYSMPPEGGVGGGGGSNIGSGAGGGSSGNSGASQTSSDGMYRGHYDPAVMGGPPVAYPPTSGGFYGDMQAQQGPYPQAQPDLSYSQSYPPQQPYGGDSSGQGPGGASGGWGN